MDFDSNDLWQFDDMPQIHIDSRGRASNAANEDDYDYALELRPGLFLVWLLFLFAADQSFSVLTLSHSFDRLYIEL